MIEYRVRKISRYVITRYAETSDGGASIETYGVFDNREQANKVAGGLNMSEPGSSFIPLDAFQPEEPLPIPTMD